MGACGWEGDTRVGSNEEAAMANDGASIKLPTNIDGMAKRKYMR